MDANSAVIEVRNIRRSFSSIKKKEGLSGALNLLVRPEYQVHEALKGVSFKIESGSFVGLIGANGAGKTTLLKILSGLIPPSSGQASVLGFEPFKRALNFRRKISLVMGQKAQLWWDLPAIDAFDLIRAIYEIPIPEYRDRLKRLVELLDVKEHIHTQIRRLSLGERMKMELIGAILHWPSVIFLDEPTIGLDLFAAHKLREFLREFNQREKATIILTSHNMDDIERLCSRVIILRSGELIYDGRPEGLTNQEERQLRIQLVDKPPLREIIRMTNLSENVVEEEATAGTENKTLVFNIKQNQIVSVLQPLMERFQIADIRIESQSLEKVIQRLYSEEKKPNDLMK